jgi:tetratricopeptide (TPR) repeat protein
LGDGTAYIDGETRQLLFNYNSIYIRLAMAMRDDPLKPKSDALRYVDMGISQFPNEWRNYAVAADILQSLGDKARAAEYLEKGLKTVPESVGLRYLQPSLNAIKKQGED